LVRAAERSNVSALLLAREDGELAGVRDSNVDKEMCVYLSV
jgi:hypothetical protein